jgi:GxxExxY protein
MTEEQLNGLAQRIIGCAFTVLNTLGCGFLEKVYQNALLHELQKNGLAAETRHPITVYYDGIIVGEYFADLIVENTIIIELKIVTGHTDIFTAQCLNYLKATGKPLCLLLNFAKPRLDINRFRGPQHSPLVNG